MPKKRDWKNELLKLNNLTNLTIDGINLKDFNNVISRDNYVEGICVCNNKFKKKVRNILGGSKICNTCPKPIENGTIINLSTDIKSIDCNKNVEFFKSIAEAEKKLNGKYRGSRSSNISLVLRGKIKTCYGKKWEFVNKIIFNTLEWKQFRDTNLYFHKDKDRYLHFQKKHLQNGDSNGRIKMKSTSILFIEALWIAFNGEIPVGHVVEKIDQNGGNLLSNLTLRDNYCKQCNTLFIRNDKKRLFCNNDCKTKFNNSKQRSCLVKEMKNDVDSYLKEKIRCGKKSNKKNKKKESLEKKINNLLKNSDPDLKEIQELRLLLEKYKYDINLTDLISDENLGFSNMKCYYCDISLKLYSDNGQDPDKLTIDAMYPEKGHVKGNCVASCWFCNRMKHTINYDIWSNKLLPFAKGDLLELDLSNNNYVKFKIKKILSSKNEEKEYYELNNDKYSIKPWDCINNEYNKMIKKAIKKNDDISKHILKNKDRFKDKGSNKIEFRKIYEKQKKNKKNKISFDCLFQLFPLVIFDAGNPFNVSCDRIIPDEPEWQLMPKFLNLAKNNLKMEEFKKALDKRGFFQKTSIQKVKIPDNYQLNSVFFLRLYDDKGITLGKGHFGMKRSIQTKQNISQSKKGKYTGFKSKKGIPVNATDQNGKIFKFGSILDAIRKLKLPQNINNNTLHSKINKARNSGEELELLGYKWEFAN
jgi:hypothetical protein